VVVSRRPFGAFEFGAAEASSFSLGNLQRSFRSGEARAVGAGGAIDRDHAITLASFQIIAGLSAAGDEIEANEGMSEFGLRFEGSHVESGVRFCTKNGSDGISERIENEEREDEAIGWLLHGDHCAAGVGDGERAFDPGLAVLSDGGGEGELSFDGCSSGPFGIACGSDRVGAAGEGNDQRKE
jgi:hypothetical protein